ncbi:hypothetical protein ACFOWB_21780 [Chenggangzhangella methanolivorans]|uniref:hypothetical protein n=1 Tax=Chenggangzhangella methanolivorans TaxID=1437009 RepID=UPI0036162AA5
MAGSDWRVFSPVGYGLAIAIIPIGFVLFALAYGEYPQRAAQNAETREQYNKSGNDALLLALRDLPSPYTNEDRCENSESDNGPDLCAQWVAANAARESYRLSFKTFIATIAGVIAAFGALIATVWAAWAATEAARTARDVSIKQFASYPHLKKGTVKVLNGTAFCKTTIINNGLSPISVFRLEVFYVAHFTDEEYQYDSWNAELYAFIGPNDDLTHRIQITINPEDALISMAGRHIAVDYTFHYETLSGERRNVFVPLMTTCPEEGAKGVMALRFRRADSQSGKYDDRPLSEQIVQHG